MAHFDALLDHFEAREIGSHIADWADETTYHPQDSAGLAMVTLEDGAIVAEWDEQGRWDVSTMDSTKAREILDAAYAEWSQEEEEEA